MTFLQGCHDAKYLGAGVSKGQADRPIYRYRPKGSQVYRVIYGDLSIRDVAADQLPKAAPPAPAGPAPTIVETIPADGMLDVDPATKEIRLHFNQDMRSGGSAMIDKDSGNPRGWLTARWLDARTCVLPVELRGSYGYTVRINEWGNRSSAAQVGRCSPAHNPVHHGPGRRPTGPDTRAKSRCHRQAPQNPPAGLPAPADRGQPG